MSQSWPGQQSCRLMLSGLMSSLLRPKAPHAQSTAPEGPVEGTHSPQKQDVHFPSDDTTGEFSNASGKDGPHDGEKAAIGCEPKIWK